MKKTIKLILISVFVLGLALIAKVQAQTLTDNEINSDICKQVVESYKKYTDAELSANVIALPFKNLQLPDGKVTFEAKSMNDKFMARDLKKINVYVDDKLVKTFNVPVEVKAYQDVLVATGFIDRERTLNSGLVMVKRVEVSNRLEYALTPKMLSKEIVAKKFFREGDIIDKRFVKMKPDVTRNELVKASFQSDNLTVEIEATAMEDGFIGDSITVENKDYRKIYRGKITGLNRVLIQM